MTTANAKNFNLPWNQHEHYRIGIYPKSGGFAAPVQDFLKQAGLQDTAGGGMAMQAPRNWKAAWDQIQAGLGKMNALGNVEAAVTPIEETPETTEAHRKPMDYMQAVADSLWLGDALLEDRVMCYLQPVVASKDKIFGYESFARVKAPEGNIIAGDKIIAASKVLGIEYMIDRHLQVQAIKTFMSSAFNGFLFVNFFPGFIHRPAVYLEGLSETAKNFGMVAKHLVLDLTKSETPRDIAHLKSICEYGRSKGYSVALDDIESVEGVRKLIPEMRPDFVKIDMQLVRMAMDPGKREIIRQIVELVHAGGSTAIAEGVETDDIHQALKSLGVDLFQGYLFSPPVPVEAVLKRSGTA